MTRGWRICLGLIINLASWPRPPSINSEWSLIVMCSIVMWLAVEKWNESAKVLEYARSEIKFALLIGTQNILRFQNELIFQNLLTSEEWYIVLFWMKINIVSLLFVLSWLQPGTCNRTAALVLQLPSLTNRFQFKKLERGQHAMFAFIWHRIRILPATTSTLKLLRMRKLRALNYHKGKKMTIVPMPEYCIKRCSPRFRPGYRFLVEPSFRHLSSQDSLEGRERNVGPYTNFFLNPLF